MCNDGAVLRNTSSRSTSFRVTCDRLLMPNQHASALIERPATGKLDMPETIGSNAAVARAFGHSIAG